MAVELREFTSANELMAHYKQLRARTWGYPKKQTPKPPKPPSGQTNLPPITYTSEAWVLNLNTPTQYRLRRRMPGAPVMVDDVILLVSDRYQVGKDAILSENRQSKIARARQVIMWIAHRKYNIPLTKIGRSLSRDHTTVLSGVRKIDQQLRDHPNYKCILNEIHEDIEDACGR